jgi:hypothetical protein
MMNDTVQYEITVKIQVSIDKGEHQFHHDEAMLIAQHYADMAIKYKSIGADKILEVKAEKMPLDIAANSAIIHVT